MPNYQFNGVALPYVASVAAPYSSRIGSAETPGRAGSYSGQQYAAERKITLTGTLVNATYSGLQDAWSNLVAAHDVSGPQPLIIRDGWYFLATVESFADSEREVDHINWDATYICADPFAFSDTLSVPTFSTVGGTFTVSGNKNALPTLALTVGSAPADSFITVTNYTTGEACTLFPDSTGEFVVDSLTETVTKSNVDEMATFQGRFISLRPGSNTISISTGGGASLYSAEISYRARAI